ncbi:hypothetical protein IPZ78_11675 [Sphingobacterium sp. WQ 366]|uniref:Fasciclin domain-containing protein n=2 Tax=Sphingobacterium bovistauri TaxID=2781959 RepID=A0ABS7Z6M2_9SPHI|nr:hypothetical protein [Sphingobacterium bovistauri]
MQMKNLYIILLPLLLLVNISCDKGDAHYYDYNTQAPVFDGTIYEYLESQPGVYDSLLLVLDRLPDLRSKLKNPDSTYTLFAVTNRSFDIALEALNTTRSLTGRSNLYLEDVGLLDLDSMTNRYVINDVFDTEQLMPFIDGKLVTSTKNNYSMHIQFRVLNASGFVGGGQQQLIFSDTNNSIFQRYWQRVNTSVVNVKTKNGIVHILSAGHDFGFSKFTSKYSTQ